MRFHDRCISFDIDRVKDRVHIQEVVVELVFDSDPSITSEGGRLSDAVAVMLRGLEARLRGLGR